MARTMKYNKINRSCKINFIAFYFRCDDGRTSEIRQNKCCEIHFCITHLFYQLSLIYRLLDIILYLRYSVKSVQLSVRVNREKSKNQNHDEVFIAFYCEIREQFATSLRTHE